MQISKVYVRLLRNIKPLGCYPQGPPLSDAILLILLTRSNHPHVFFYYIHENLHWAAVLVAPTSASFYQQYHCPLS